MAHRAIAPPWASALARHTESGISGAAVSRCGAILGTEAKGYDALHRAFMLHPNRIPCPGLTCQTVSFHLGRPLVLLCSVYSCLERVAKSGRVVQHRARGEAPGRVHADVASLDQGREDRCQ